MKAVSRLRPAFTLFVLFVLIGLVLCALPSVFADDEDGRHAVVILLHPGLKHWSEVIDAELAKRPFQAIMADVGVPGAPRPAPTQSAVRGRRLDSDAHELELRPSGRTGEATAAGTNGGRCVSEPPRGPYALHYRKSPKEKSTPLFRSICDVAPQPDPAKSAEKFAEEVFRIPRLEGDLSNALAARLGDEKAQAAKQRIPVKVIQGKDGPVAEVKTHNQWPFCVHVVVNNLRGLPGASLSFPMRDQRGNLVDNRPKFFLEPDAKHTLLVTNLQGLFVDHANCGVGIVDAKVAPK